MLTPAFPNYVTPRKLTSSFQREPCVSVSHKRYIRSHSFLFYCTIFWNYNIITAFTPSLPFLQLSLYTALLSFKFIATISIIVHTYRHTLLYIYIFRNICIHLYIIYISSVHVSLKCYQYLKIGIYIFINNIYVINKYIYSARW